MELTDFFKSLIEASPYTLPLICLIVYLWAEVRFYRNQLETCRERTRALYRHMAQLPDEHVNGNS